MILVVKYAGYFTLMANVSLSIRCFTPCCTQHTFIKIDGSQGVSETRQARVLWTSIGGVTTVQWTNVNFSVITAVHLGKFFRCDWLNEAGCLWEKDENVLYPLECRHMSTTVLIRRRNILMICVTMLVTTLCQLCRTDLLVEHTHIYIWKA